MIIEAFGPPGAGKTTFSRALAQRLRQRGYTVDLILFPRLESEFLSRGGFLPALLRAISAIFVAIAILCRPISNAPGLRLARDLLRLMPPASPAWWIKSVNTSSGFPVRGTIHTSPIASSCLIKGLFKLFAAWRCIAGQTKRRSLRQLA